MIDIKTNNLKHDTRNFDISNIFNKLMESFEDINHFPRKRNEEQQKIYQLIDSQIKRIINTLNNFDDEKIREFINKKSISYLIKCWDILHSDVYLSNDSLNKILDDKIFSCIKLKIKCHYVNIKNLKSNVCYFKNLIITSPTEEVRLLNLVFLSWNFRLSRHNNIFHKNTKLLFDKINGVIQSKNRTNNDVIWHNSLEELIKLTWICESFESSYLFKDCKHIYKNLKTFIKPSIIAHADKIDSRWIEKSHKLKNVKIYNLISDQSLIEKYSIPLNLTSLDMSEKDIKDERTIDISSDTNKSFDKELLVKLIDQFAVYCKESDIIRFVSREHGEKTRLYLKQRIEELIESIDEKDPIEVEFTLMDYTIKDLRNLEKCCEWADNTLLNFNERFVNNHRTSQDKLTESIVIPLKAVIFEIDRKNISIAYFDDIEVRNATREVKKSSLIFNNPSIVKESLSDLIKYVKKNDHILWSTYSDVLFKLYNFFKQLIGKRNLSESTNLIFKELDNHVVESINKRINSLGIVDKQYKQDYFNEELEKKIITKYSDLNSSYSHGNINYGWKDEYKIVTENLPNQYNQISDIEKESIIPEIHDDSRDIFKDQNLSNTVSRTSIVVDKKHTVQFDRNILLWTFVSIIFLVIITCLFFSLLY